MVDTLVRSGVLASLLAVSFASWADTAVGYGKITAVKAAKVENSKAQIGGALVGGAIGLISGRGHSGSNQALRAVGGGVAGQQVAKLASSKQAYEYTILMSGTTTTVVTDEAGLRVGDCVAVERGAYTNLRLVADAQCAPKDEVVKAQTDEAFDRAERKMRLLCVD